MNKSILIFALVIITSCSSSKDTIPELSFENLYKISGLEITAENDKLNIIMNNDSFIYFEDYIHLKNIVLLDINYEKLKKYNEISITTPRKGIVEIKTTFTKKEIDSIHNKFKENQYLKRNFYIIASIFDISEIGNLRNEALTASKLAKDEIEIDYLTLIEKCSKAQNEMADFEKSSAIQRLVILKEMFNEIGIMDAWTRKRKKSEEFIEKLELLIKKINIA